jgi:plasmid maintenance system antidote protein VapI
MTLPQSDYTRIGEQIHAPLWYLHKLLNDEASITPHVAIGLGKLENIDPMLWMELQAAYDLWHASQDTLAVEVSQDTLAVEGVVYGGANLLGTAIDYATYSQGAGVAVGQPIAYPILISPAIGRSSVKSRPSRR